MLYIVFSSLILLAVFSGWGSVIERFFGKFFTGISSKLLSGIFFLILLSTFYAFFFPTNIYFETGLIIVGLISFFISKNYTEFSHFFAGNQFVFAVIFIITAFFGSYYPYILDHFGYYLPTIKWISEVGLVKGISNLDLLLGQSSFWHIFQASFSNFADPFIRMNTIVLIVYLIYIFEKKRWLHLVFLPILYLFAQSPSPDLPVITFSLIILHEILNRNNNVSHLLFFSAVIFAIKPTMIWLPLLVILYGFLEVKKPVKFLLSAIPAALVFILKNYWTFGFPVFPVQIGGLDVAWEPHPLLLKTSSEIAIIKTYNSQYTFAQISQFTGFEYIKNLLFLDGIKGKIHLLFLFTLVFMFVFALLKKSRIIWLVFFSILIKSILVLLFSAQYRFFIDVFFVAALILLYQRFKKKQAIAAFGILTIISFSFLTFPKVVKKLMPSFRLSGYMMGFQKYQLVEPSQFTLKKYQQHQIGNLKFNVVEGYPFSFDTPLPAISPEFLKEYLEAGIFPQQKSADLKDGFYWRKMNQQEEQRLREIVSKINPKFFNK